MANSSKRTLFSSTGIYMSGSIIGNIASLLSWLVYSRVMTPESFAPMAILLGFIQILVTLTSAGVQYPIIRNIESSKGIQSVWYGYIWVAVSTLIIVAVGLPILYLVDNSSLITVNISVTLATFVIVGRAIKMLSLPTEGYLRAMKLPWIYVGITAAPNIFSSVVGVVIALINSDGVIGIAWAQLVIGLTSGSIGIYGLIRFTKRISDSKFTNAYPFREYLELSLPFVPHVLFSQILDNVPRWLLLNFGSIASVSFYTLGRSLSRPLGTLPYVFNLAWSPEVISIKSGKTAYDLRNHATLLTFIITSVGCLSIMIPERFFTLLLGSQWYGVKTFLPFLVTYLICQGLYIFPAAVILASNKTYLTPIISGTALVMTALSGLMLGTWFGSNGIGWAFSIGSVTYIFSGLLIAYRADNSKLFRTTIPNLPIALSIAFLVATTIFSMATGNIQFVGWTFGSVLLAYSGWSFIRQGTLIR